MMRSTRKRLLATVLWVISLVLTVIGLALTVIAGSQHPDELISVLYLVTGALGMIIATRMPSNVVGWLLIVAGLFSGVQALAVGYADLALNAGTGSPSLGLAAALLSLALWAPVTFVPLILVLLFFPDGRLPSPRWRWVLWVAVAGIVWISIFTILPFHEDVGGENPRWAIVNSPAAESSVPVALELIWWLVPISMIATGISLLIRFRRAAADERQQLKWVVYGGTLAVTLWLIGGQAFDETTLGGILTSIAVTLIPVSIGVAILRYRLYDIDRLISRTVSYAVVAGLLAAVFAVIAIGLPQLVGVPEDEQFLVAGATLAVAALFNPLRRRVQGIVDRRFNRARYDAQQEVERLAESLRDEVRLDDVSNDLIDVAAKTMQPESASVWIKGRR